MAATINRLLILSRPWYWLPTTSSAVAAFATNAEARCWGSAFLLIITVGPGLSAFAEIVDDIADVSIDRNSSSKLFLGMPLAGGTALLHTAKVSLRAAYIAAAASAALGLLATKLKPNLAALYLSGLVLAITYSVPPIRFKCRVPFGLIAQIIGYGPIAFHLGVFAAGGHHSSRSIAASLFVGAWTGIVGMTADLLDFEDDRANNVVTVVSAIGRRVATVVIIATGALLLVGSMLCRQHAGMFTHTILLTALVAICFLEAALLLRNWDANLPPWVHVLTLATELIFPFVIVT